MPDASREEVGRAIALFQATEDASLLLEALRLARPRAAAAVRRYQARSRAVPPPAAVEPVLPAASREQALRTLRRVEDFALLQALTRAIGRRLEVLREPPA
jgi:hypothetical protein